MTDIPTPDRQNVARPVDHLFPEAAAAKRAGLCPRCGEAVDVTEFVGPVDRCEFEVSGMCLNCQTVVFQSMEEEG